MLHRKFEMFVCMKRLSRALRYGQPMGAQGGVLSGEEAGPPRHRHSTPSDGDEVAAAVDQQSDARVCTEDPEGFLQGGQVTEHPDRASAPLDVHRWKLLLFLRRRHHHRCPPAAAAHHQIATIDVSQLHAIWFDRLSPVLQDGKYAH